jgi:hypothetical protein
MERALRVPVALALLLELAAEIARGAEPERLKVKPN